jgi:hypothetical protein
MKSRGKIEKYVIEETKEEHLFCGVLRRREMSSMIHWKRGRILISLTEIKKLRKGSSVWRDECSYLENIKLFNKTLNLLRKVQEIVGLRWRHRGDNNCYSKITSPPKRNCREKSISSEHRTLENVHRKRSYTKMQKGELG